MAELQFDHVTVRNTSYEPDLSKEGTYLCRMPVPPSPPEGAENWHSHLTPHERLYYHQTMNSVRFCKRFKPNPYIPQDSLEFQLQSRYDHSREAFPEKIDSLLQCETCAAKSIWMSDGKDGATEGEGGYTVGKNRPFRVLKNTVTVRIKRAEELGHPLHIGGIKEKVSPHSVKLICSGVHNQLVNNGFSRQTSDGNFFRY